MEIIYRYTRKQAIADGFQVDVTETAREAGVKFPVFVNRTVFDHYVAIPEDVTAQDESGRLWDILWMLRFAIMKGRAEGSRTSASVRASGSGERLPIALYVRNDNRRPKLVKLIAVCGALDIDDPQPAITVMLPDDD